MTIQDAEGWLKRARGKGWVQPRLSAEFDVIGWEPGPVPCPPDEARQGRTIIAAAVAPADLGKLSLALHRLRLLTKARTRTEQEIDEQITIYVEELKSFPLEVIERSCRQHARTSAFWPALAELIQPCEQEVRPLKQALTILEKVPAHAA